MKKVVLLFIVVFSCMFFSSCIDRSVPPLQNNTEWLSEDGEIHIYFIEGFDRAVLLVEDKRITVPMTGYTEIYICPQEAFYDNTVTTDVGMFSYEMLSKDKNGKCDKMKIVFVRGDFYEIGTKFVVNRVAENLTEKDLPPIPLRENTEEDSKTPRERLFSCDSKKSIKF